MWILFSFFTNNITILKTITVLNIVFNFQVLIIFVTIVNQLFISFLIKKLKSEFLILTVLFRPKLIKKRLFKG